MFVNCKKTARNVCGRLNAGDVVDGVVQRLSLVSRFSISERIFARSGRPGKPLIKREREREREREHTVCTAELNCTARSELLEKYG